MLFKFINYQDIKSILIPTTEEEQADYMHDFTRCFDESDATINQWMEIIESGVEIFGRMFGMLILEVDVHFFEMKVTMSEIKEMSNKEINKRNKMLHMMICLHLHAIGLKLKSLLDGQKHVKRTIAV